jgi:hypothetical protein
MWSNLDGAALHVASIRPDVVEVDGGGDDLNVRQRELRSLISVDVEVKSIVPNEWESRGR